jgi:hypothetical protein
LKDDKKILDLEEEKFYLELKSMQENGILNVQRSADGELDIQLNALVASGLINQLGDIPLHIDLYKNIKKKIKKKKDLHKILSGILAINGLEFNEKGRDLDLLKGEIECDEENMSYYYGLIYDFYDLDNPVMDFKKPYYWFKVKKEIIDDINNKIKNQNPRDFAKFFLK